MCENIYIVNLLPFVIILNENVSFLKNIFSASNSFMHIFNMSVTYLQNAEKIQWKL